VRHARSGSDTDKYADNEFFTLVGLPILAFNGNCKKVRRLLLPVFHKSMLKLSPSTLYDATEKCRKISSKAARSIGFGMVQGFQSPKWLALQVATHHAEAGEGASEQHHSRAAIRLLLGGYHTGFETVRRSVLQTDSP
jgi:hypothetical protein